ncbi:MAG: hypothetical protein U0518_05410 [Candidatus Gracilibacteria bacterium]
MSSRIHEIKLTNPVSCIKAANRRSLIQDTLTELAVEGIFLYCSKEQNSPIRHSDENQNLPFQFP